MYAGFNSDFPNGGMELDQFTAMFPGMYSNLIITLSYGLHIVVSSSCCHVKIAIIISAKGGMDFQFTGILSLDRLPIIISFTLVVHVPDEMRNLLLQILTRAT